MIVHHWRTKNGVAACSLPALQAQLVDDRNEVTCPACRKLAGLGGAA